MVVPLELQSAVAECPQKSFCYLGSMFENFCIHIPTYFLFQNVGYMVGISLVKMRLVCWILLRYVICVGKWEDVQNLLASRSFSPKLSCKGLFESAS